ncbi:class I adenylate-forming enzyme family protein [Phaeobacter gallaeciensis]|uniref:Acyl-CoA synthetase (AMP-forming)/AMP-acid ligase II n=1 Tax=Phaeobacter gallaeciensis TaxID=60890 RepID=A0AAC9Z9J0_9RHOB|nr:class I adenylate-forming enzyme family protein [Phaeobacter gallaeciensis]AHD09659.1 Acyl-CoA synthetase (AMP-forming)/AMP-acid ligase II [Phaeobacter gallaeciensis DSM 26640]ATE92923.1 Acyl-CoA synthetase (AMP-forming)/AMP-acid ligase II [Phaeobacter gallaeciensis]ATE97255.1 Acyl-CoA synthetase (AMP-forming)/AMP-acid ligase II [Phaeobacter gallaeciensis]ATF01588.1 Acyl-CoA synthetase (AMP-forming)/AMP-acid ligase II [Phaeobacter gallaeciensis]ATF05968.1 Acyl-CoA synthetase (AMP-forming)/A
MQSVSDSGLFPPCPAPFNLADHVLYQRAPGCTADVEALALCVLAPHVQPNDATPDDLREPQSRELTYGALRAAVRGVGTGLLAQGLTPGDRVLLRLGNTPIFPIAYLAAIAVGLVPVPTSAQLTEPEVARIIDDLSPAAILRDPGIASAPHPREIERDSLEAMQRSAPPENQFQMQLGDPDRPAYIVYTSGTGGNPRAVVHAHRAIWARQMMIRHWYDLRPTDRLLHAGAFNWTFTLGTGLMDPWSLGATALIPEDGTPIAALPDLLRQYDASLFAAAPGVYRKLLQQDQTLHLPALRYGLCAGEKLSSQVARDWRTATGTALYEAFGMSECSTFISADPARRRDPEQTGDTLGWPQPGRRLAILDSDGSPVPRNTSGVIAIDRRDPGLMLGYYNAATATEDRYQGAWFLTGDLGEMTEDGQIRYLGRNDDMMNAGGYRVSPLEVEAALATHPDLEQVAVASVEVKPDTHIIVAFYTSAKDVTDEALSAFAKDRLARYKQPRAYLRLDALPSGANGKLLRRALPDCYIRHQRTPS